MLFLGYVRQIEQPLPIAEPMVYEVKKGASPYRVVQDLYRQGVIIEPNIAKIYVRYAEVDSRLKAGEFELEPGLTLVTLFELLTSNQHVRYKITLVEGSTFSEARALLAREERLEQTLEGVADNELIARLSSEGVQQDSSAQDSSIVFSHPEGSLYPDTYFFHKGDSDYSILSRAYARLNNVLSEEWAARQKGLPLKTSYEALILASIVEKETGQPSERGEIAGVFVRRIEKRMRLQTDPTVIYGLGDRYQGNITRAHLREKTAYNTYRINGLPPTPIALVGREAIHAALNPKEGKSLYFVAKGDGSHAFSETIEQHNKAVREYQLRRRSDYRSAPSE